jgi:RNA polymerase sigma factor (sigma-70 family)
MRALTSSSSDASLIHASVSNPQAFAELFDRHAPVIWRYACRRAGAGAADEVVSETFLRAFSSRRAYNLKHPDARPWLYGIATNVLREYAREEARRGRGDERPSPSDLLDGELERVEARADAIAQVPATVAALARLEPVDRETLLLYALTDLDYQQIAIAMAVPVGTVRSRLNRARRRMRGQLGLADPGASANVATEGRQQ